MDSEQKLLSWYCTTEGGYIASKSVQRATLKEAVTEFCANMFEDTRVNPNLYVAVAYFADQRRVLLRRSDILNIVRQKDKKKGTSGRFVGNAALGFRRDGMEVAYPVVEGVVRDWDAAGDIIKHALK